jgi:hypothetical protein
MDRHYYYEKMQKQREREISRNLAAGHLFAGGRCKLSGEKRVMPLFRLPARATIVLTILLLIHFFI